MDDYQDDDFNAEGSAHQHALESQRIYEEIESACNIIRCGLANLQLIDILKPRTEDHDDRNYH